MDLVRQGFEMIDYGGFGESFERMSRYSFDRILFSLLPYINITSIRKIFMIRSKMFSELSDANPTNPIWVDPKKINYEHGDGKRTFGLVLDGDWDDPDKKFTDTVHHKSIFRRYKCGVEWEETELYEYYCNRLGSSRESRIDLYEGLENYFNEIDKLYKSITNDGYMTQEDLLLKNHVFREQLYLDAPHPILNEVGINIYRDGTMARAGSGRHRLSIARISNVEKIPVTVRVRHSDWQEIREKVKQTESVVQMNSEITDHIHHPDLKDLMKNNS